MLIGQNMGTLAMEIQLTVKQMVVATIVRYDSGYVLACS